jgi:hypothetical protein
MSRTEVKVLAIIFTLAIAGGAIAGTNQTVRKLFGQKFETYNYPSCKDVKCSVEFFIGSKIALYTPPTPSGEAPIPDHSYLISPTFEGKNNMNMRIDVDKIAAASTSAGKGLLAVYGNCSGKGLTEAFTEDLPNFGGSANVCASLAKLGNTTYVVGYTSVFESKKTGSFIIIGINENIELNSKGQISNQVFDMTKYQNDIATVLQSLDVKSK